MAFDTFELNLFNWNLRGKPPLHIFFFGDTHDDARASVDDHIEDIRKRSAKLPYESCLFIGMGDYGDFASTSERKSIRHSGLHDTTIDKLDEVADRDLKNRVKQLDFMRGRLIGLHNGNHDWAYQDGSHASERLASALGCRHLGYSAYTHVKIASIRPHTDSYVSLFTSHGKSGGRLLGAPWNSLEQMSRIFHDAEIFAMGHDHSLGGIPDTRLYVEMNTKTGELVLKEKKRLFIRTGSALRGYESGKKSYISKALYKPCSLGFPVAIVEWKRVRSEGRDVLLKDLHVWA